MAVVNGCRVHASSNVRGEGRRGELMYFTGNGKFIISSTKHLYIPLGKCLDET
jgi:hypothetical protein